jgi:hypothetical protein
MDAARLAMTRICLAVLAVAVAAAPAQAKPTRAQRAKSTTTLRSVVERVPSSTANRYGARDDRGAPLEGLKAAQVGDRTVGVYHAPNGAGRFDTFVATSRDLLHWTRRALLDQEASQPTILALPGGSVLVAYEKVAELDVLRRPLLPGLAPLDSSPDRIRVRFRYYRSVDELLEGRHARQFTAPRRLSPTAEGTPHIIGATLRRGLISRSRIEVGLHAFQDVDRDGRPDADRRATAVLTDFRRWESRAAPELDAPFMTAGVRHAGFAAPPSGNIGDRDQIVLDGVRLQLHEAQYVAGDFGTWRPFLLDPRTSFARPLNIATHGGSTAFGNPTVSAVTAPSGRPALLMTMYVFSEGAAPGESGSLLYYHER